MHQRPIYSACILERSDNHLLIAKITQDAGNEAAWRFPRGPAEASESPEAAMRRIAKHDLGVEVDMTVGQPPLIMEIDGQQVELRYFFCTLAVGEPNAQENAECRWVLRGQLLEYDFDPQSQPVVDWLLE